MRWDAAAVFGLKAFSSLQALFQLCGCSSFVLVLFRTLACLRWSPSFACHRFRHSVSMSFLSSCIFFYCPFSVPCASTTMLCGSLGSYQYCLVYYKPGRCHFPLFIRDIYFTLPPAPPVDLFPALLAVVWSMCCMYGLNRKCNPNQLVQPS